MEKKLIRTGCMCLFALNETQTEADSQSAAVKRK